MSTGRRLQEMTAIGTLLPSVAGGILRLAPMTALARCVCEIDGMAEGQVWAEVAFGSLSSNGGFVRIAAVRTRRSIGQFGLLAAIRCTVHEGPQWAEFVHFRN